MAQQTGGFIQPEQPPPLLRRRAQRTSPAFDHPAFVRSQTRWQLLNLFLATKGHQNNLPHSVTNHAPIGAIDRQITVEIFVPFCGKIFHCTGGALGEHTLPQHPRII